MEVRIFQFFKYTCRISKHRLSLCRQEHCLCSVYKNIKQQTVFKDAKQAILYALLIPVVENSISEKEIIIRNAAAVCGGQDCCAL